MLPYNERSMASTTIREYAGGSVGGILRKTGNMANNKSYNSNVNYGGTQAQQLQRHGEQRQIDLLVFGYACKVFRDDEKAGEVDQGKHLIPWMGDTNLKIDRYDVRGALCNLSPFEAPPGGYGNRLDYLSSEEQRAEQLCEEERYLFLYNNEEEHILRQEEDLKSLRQESEGGIDNYNQVDFKYGNGTESGAEQGPCNAAAADVEEIEQPYVAPINLEVPAHIQLPETMKQHAIIEKTARFIASQGAQMEILLKAKQSNNVQFEFLTQNGVLNPYYKHLVEAIKQGAYLEQPNTHEDVAIGDDADKSSTTTVITKVAGIDAPTGGSSICLNDMNKKPVITVPTIKYKPSANCAYTQLISKIKGVPLQTVIDDDANSNLSMADINSPTLSVQSSNGEFTPVLLQYNGSTFEHATVNVPSVTNEESNDNDSRSNNGELSKVEIIKNTSAFALAQYYSSDTDTDTDGESEAAILTTTEAGQPQPETKESLEIKLSFPIPEDNLRTIIDKTATYVIKNGRQFEETLRTKSVERFVFLLSDNEYYPYYMYKITDDPDAASKEQKARKAAAVAAALLSKKGLLSVSNANRNVEDNNKLMVPVSFSIKTKDEHTQKVQQPALPQEETSDDDDNDNAAVADADDIKLQKQNQPTHQHPHHHDIKIALNALPSVERQVPERVQRAIKVVESQLLARNGTTVTVAGTNTTTGTTTSPVFDSQTTVECQSQANKTQKELKKKPEDKVKDKLAQIAREKLGGLLSKQKQLQLERKRKALAFLNQIKGDAVVVAVEKSLNQAESSAAAGDDAKKSKATAINMVDDGKGSDSDASSVRSIPITSYGPENYDDEDNIDDGVVDVRNITWKNDKIQKINKSGSVAKEIKTQKSHTQTVLLSDDDDVQLISETRAASTTTTPLLPSPTSTSKAVKPSSSTLLHSSKAHGTDEYKKLHSRERKRQRKHDERRRRRHSHERSPNLSSSSKIAKLKQDMYDCERRHKADKKHRHDREREHQRRRQKEQQEQREHRQHRRGKRRRRSSSSASASSDDDSCDSTASSSVASSTILYEASASYRNRHKSSQSQPRKLSKNEKHFEPTQDEHKHRRRTHKHSTKRSSKRKSKSKKHSRSRSRS